MNKEIVYNGYTTVPSDYECADGDLSAAINLVPEDGGLRPLMQPKTIMDLPDKLRVVYVHRTTGYTHYIVYDSEGNMLKWTTDGAEFMLLHGMGKNELYRVEGIGNTLIALCSDGMHYSLWKADRKAYVYLGTEIPELSLSFGLQAEMRDTGVFEIGIGTHQVEGFWDKVLPEESQTWITSQVLGKVNKFIADNSVNAGCFIFPFFVRYAYRLYDGSLVKHSAPILMETASGLAPGAKAKMISTVVDKEWVFTDAEIRIIAACHRLDYAAMGDVGVLQDWRDIVSSVDIFISKPIYTYDQNGTCESFSRVAPIAYSVCKHTNRKRPSAYPDRYQVNTVGGMAEVMNYPEDLETDPQRPTGYLNLPARSDREVSEDIKGNALFYFLKSIRMEDLDSKRKLVEIQDDYLQSLVNREVMTDDYDSHDLIIPRYAFIYNSRVNIANLRKEIFRGFKADTFMPFSNGYISWRDDAGHDEVWDMGYYIYIKQDGRDIVVEGGSGQIGYGAPVPFIYYPNTNAYKVVFWNKSPTADRRNYYEAKLEKHDFLNGAFYFDDWYGIVSRGIGTTTIPVPSTAEERMVGLPNKIYTSEVNNPFYFPLSGINTVGTGEILGICSAVKALSQGQFGQFPLYAFSTEGVWALELSATGTYIARQPVTRDVCVNSGSITQIDTAVLFATDRGIMLLQGAESICLSDVIAGQNKLDLSGSTLPHYDELLAMAGYKADDLHVADFFDFAGRCRMIYDYPHQRIVVYAPDVRLAYVYSLKSKMWGMMTSNITDSVNAYPEALAVTDDGRLVDFSRYGEERRTGFLLTRPLKLDAPDVHKTVATVIQRGYFRKGNVRCVLYGSRDLFHWFALWSSADHYLRGFSGTPYKFFRLAILTDFPSDECLLGCSVVYGLRLANRLR